MASILLIEDNQNLARGLQNNLEIDGHTVLVAADGATGLVLARSSAPDLIVLDLMLPVLDGYRVLRSLREEGSETPVLILSAKGEETDKVLGFHLGADDYVAKPFGLLELLARIEALLRRASSRGSRANGHGTAILRFGDVEIDQGTHTVTRHGVPLSLRPKEYELLLALVSRKGRLATRAELLDEVWKYSGEVYSRTVDTHVAELRRKLEEDPARPRLILTVRKSGYRMDCIARTSSVR